MKEHVQKFGRFLSGMVMPNIGAFIAWGLIAALFIPDGWLGKWGPAATINTMVGPMLQYLLPILIGYTGGRASAARRERSPARWLLWAPSPLPAAPCLSAP